MNHFRSAASLLSTLRPWQTRIFLPRYCSSSKNLPEAEESAHGVAEPSDKPTVIQKLIRLSQSSPEEYASLPQAASEEELRTAKARYADVLRDYRQNFSKDEFLRRRNPNYRGRGGGFGGGDNFSRNNWRGNDRDDDWDGGGSFGGYGGGQRRYFSTCVTDYKGGVDAEGSPSIVDKLRKLSSSQGGGYRDSERPERRRSNSWGGKEARSEHRGDRSEYRGDRSEYRGDREHGEYRSGGRDRADSTGNWKQSSNKYAPAEYKQNSSRHYDRRDRATIAEPGYQRVFRKTTEDEARIRQVGRNQDDTYISKDQAKKAYWKKWEKPGSTAVMGDYTSSLASAAKREAKTKTNVSTSRSSPQSESKLDLASALSSSDADTFGTLSLGPVPVKDYVGAALKKELLHDAAALGMGELDEPEEDDVTFKPDQEDRWNMLKLVARVKLLVDEMKVKEAVDTVNSALAQGGFEYSPQKFQYIYNLLISSCASVGYVKMAFKLFKDMKIRGFHPRESTYTSLFNACSNSTWDAEANIERMERLRELMLEKGVAPNQIVYHAMIKGYGRNGDIESAFGIVDEMISSGGLSPNTETFNMLLQACISNTENGFRHLLVTWRKMAQMGIRPDIYTFNLLLRGVRECGIVPEPQLIGDEAKIPKISHSSQDTPLLPPITSEEESNDMLNLLCLNEPEALVRMNQRDSGVKPYSYLDLIDALKQAQNRLTVFGGLRGFMSEMAMNKVGPNLKTVTELGQIIHPSEIGDLIMMMKTYKLNPDITFFNGMMKRYYDTGNSVGAKQLARCLPQFGLTPNIMTWGVCATGARSLDAAQQLLEEMDAAKFVPNIQIMGAFLTQATIAFDPTYVYWVMEELRHREIQPEPRFIYNIEQFRDIVKKGIISKEMGKAIQPYKLDKILSSEEDSALFLEDMRIFRNRYKRWVEKTEVTLSPKDPWEEDFANYKKTRSHGTLSEDKSDPDAVISNAAN